jgi:hypothetical protein
MHNERIRGKTAGNELVRISGQEMKEYISRTCIFFAMTDMGIGTGISRIEKQEEELAFRFLRRGLHLHHLHEPTEYVIRSE